MDPTPAKLDRLRGVLANPEGLRSRLYGGGSSNDDRIGAGVGEETFRAGLREDDVNRFVRRLAERREPAPGAGDEDMSRRNGLGRGIVDDGRAETDGLR